MCLQFRPMVAGTLTTGVFHLALVVIFVVLCPPCGSGLGAGHVRGHPARVWNDRGGAKAEFAFKFTNKYLYDVHVARVRSSCGCSDVRVTKDSLATYESGEVVASINSQRLRGDQSSTLTVIFDKPRYAEVQLKVTVYIRGDILLEPSGFDFGEVEQGADASRKLTVTHYGDADWKIVDVLGSADHLECELGEPVRSGNRVSYSLTAKLAAGAPAGGLGTQLLLVTNDPRAEKIPVMVEGSVRSLVSVAPASCISVPCVPASRSANVWSSGPRSLSTSRRSAPTATALSSPTRPTRRRHCTWSPSSSRPAIRRAP